MADIERAQPTTPVSFGTFIHGAKSSIGATALALTATKPTTPIRAGVLIRASLSNTGKVYVGASSSVTAASADSTDGFELGAGDSVMVETNDPTTIYLIGSTTGQKVYFLYI